MSDLSTIGKQRWASAWRELADGLVIGLDDPAAAKPSGGWAQRLKGVFGNSADAEQRIKFWFNDSLEQLRNPPDPVRGPRGLSRTAQHACAIAIRAFVAEPARVMALRWATNAQQLADATISREAYWLGGYEDRSNAFIMAAGEGCARRVRAYCQWLRGAQALNPDELRHIAAAFARAGDAGRAQHENVRSRVYTLDAIRVALLAGDVVRAQAIVAQQPAMRGFERQFAAHARLTLAIAASNGGRLTDAKEIAIFEALFDDVRFPSRVFEVRAKRAGKFFAAALNGERLFHDAEIVALELALIKDRYIHGQSTPDLERVIGYIAE